MVFGKISVAQGCKPNSRTVVERRGAKAWLSSSQLQPQDPLYYSLLGRIYDQSGNKKEAITNYEIGLSRGDSSFYKFYIDLKSDVKKSRN